MRTQAPRLLPHVFLVLIGLLSGPVAASEDRPLGAILEPESPARGIHYFRGSLENRTPKNGGMNVNIGFVVTEEGVVLVGSGPSRAVARRIEAAIAKVTDRPITHVVNLGSQDHRWLGNEYFLEHGARIIALRRTAETQARFADEHLRRLEGHLGREAMEGTRPVQAPDPVDADRHAFEVGGVHFQLVHAGDAHFPGDAMLRLPDRDVVFTGDVVYTDRLLGIHPWSDPLGQRAAFRTLESWEPEIVIPGHGSATDLDGARRHTGDYLTFLVDGVQRGLEDWESLDQVVERLSGESADPFRDLRHFEDWHRLNVNRTYLFLEQRMMDPPENP
ncbi:MAG: MBL fold metallo-hydrolase [Ectothiorhodospira sp.]